MIQSPIVRFLGLTFGGWVTKITSRGVHRVHIAKQHYEKVLWINVY